MSRSQAEAIVDSLAPGGAAVLSPDGTLSYVSQRFCEKVKATPESILGERLERFLNKVDRAALKRMLAEDVSAPGQLTLRIDPKVPIPLHLSLRVLPSDNPLERAAVVLLDDPGNSRQEVENKLRQKIAQQAAIVAFAQRSIESLDLAELAGEATQSVAGILNTRTCLILELTPDPGQVVIRAGVGLQRAAVGDVLPLESLPATHQSLAMGNPVVESYDSLALAPPWFSDIGMISSLVVPIPGKERCYGALAAHSTGPRVFTTDDLDFARAIASIYGQAVERHQSQAELRQSEIYYRSLFENVSDIISVLEPDGTLLFASKSAQEVLGRFAPPKTNVSEFHHPDYRPKLLKAYERALKTHRPVQLESLVLHEDGSWRQCEIILRATTSLAGRPAVISTLRDISERKGIERDRSLLALIVDSSDLAITSRDVQGRITSWNPAAKRLYGYEASEVLGHARDVFELGERAVEVRKRFEAVIRTGQAQRFETKRTRKDGSLVEVSVVMSPLFGPDGELLGSAAISNDITERRLTERARELARSNAELEQLANISAHDLKEPLRQIGVFAQLLQKRLGQGQDPSILGPLGYIQDSARRSQELIAALLQYSRLAAEGPSLTAIDCNAVVKKVIWDFAAVSQSAGVTITFEPLPVAMADPVLLTQVFQNLIGNAIKFRGATSPAIHVNASRQSDEWLFSVRDNGIGIAPEYSERIFEMFQRLHRSGTYEGAGMGLAICKRAVERLGGKIFVESEPGKGSIFHFTIPA